jgi:lysophospholipase L1-like esterase
MFRRLRLGAKPQADEKLPARRPAVLSKTALQSFFLFCRRGFIGLVAAYVFSSFAFGGTKSAKPVFHVLAGACAGWLVVYQLVLRRAVNPSPRSGLGKIRNLAASTRPVARILEIVAFNLVLTLVLGECSIRLFAAVTGNSLLVSDVIDAHKLVPGHDYGYGLQGNHLGFPGHEFEKEKRPGILRVAALGDSFAVGPAVPFQDNFLTLLEGDLAETEIYNFGVSGSGPREYLAILRQQVWQFHPDLVVVCVFLGNDITESWPLPRNMDPRNHSLYLFLTRSWALLQERSKHRDSAVPAGFNRMAASALSEGTYWAVEGRRLEVCLDPPSASMEKKWHQALGYLDRIVNECRTHRTPVAFLLIPDEFQVDAAVLEKASEARGARAEELDLDLPQRRLRRFCTERRVPCLDLKTYFERENKTYAPHDTHWNEKGNRLAASWMAPWLRQLIEDRGIEDRGSRLADQEDKSRR